MTQKFQVGDLVHIKKELPKCMSHFTSDKDAIVTGYSHNSCQTGNDWEHSYSLHIKGLCEVSWYHNSNLDLMERNRLDLLKQWEEDQREETNLKSDLDWIFKNGEDVIKSPHGASIQTLAACFGLINLWGSHGEGFVYIQNSMVTLLLSTPYLKTGNKAGWIEMCEKIKKSTD